MSLDFKAIEDEVVGLELMPSNLTTHHRARQVKFGEFIEPYAKKAESVQQVYTELQKRLGLIDLANYTNEGVDRPTELIAQSALDRESIARAISLIRRNYLIEI